MSNDTKFYFDTSEAVKSIETFESAADGMVHTIQRVGTEGKRYLDTISNFDSLKGINNTVQVVKNSLDTLSYNLEVNAQKSSSAVYKLVSEFRKAVQQDYEEAHTQALSQGTKLSADLLAQFKEAGATLLASDRNIINERLAQQKAAAEMLAIQKRVNEQLAATAALPRAVSSSRYDSFGMVRTNGNDAAILDRIIANKEELIVPVELSLQPAKSLSNSAGGGSAALADMASYYGGIEAGEAADVILTKARLIFGDCAVGIIFGLLPGACACDDLLRVKAVRRCPKVDGGGLCHGFRLLLGGPEAIDCGTACGYCPGSF